MKKDLVKLNNKNVFVLSISRFEHVVMSRALPGSGLQLSRRERWQGTCEMMSPSEPVETVYLIKHVDQL